MKVVISSVILWLFHQQYRSSGDPMPCRSQLPGGWNCDEYRYTATDGNGCSAFKRNFSDLTFLQSPNIPCKQTEINGSMSVSWKYNATESDNNTVGFYLSKRNVRSNDMNCRIFLFKRYPYDNRNIQIEFRTELNKADDIIPPIVTPVVKQFYDTHEWNSTFMLSVFAPDSLKVSFDTRSGISRYNVTLYSSNSIIVDYRQIRKNSIVYTNISRGKYYIEVTAIDPKPNGNCICFTGTPQFPYCTGCKKLLSPVFKYPQSKSDIFEDAYKDKSDSDMNVIWPVVGSLLTASFVLAAAILLLFLKRRQTQKSKIRRKSGNKLVYIVYTADHSPHFAVVEQFVHFLRSCCKCDVIWSHDFKLEKMEERMHSIRSTIDTCDIIFVIGSQLLLKSFTIQNVCESLPDDTLRQNEAVDTLLYIINRQTFNNLKGEVHQVTFSYVPKDIHFLGLKVKTSCFIPEELSLFVKNIHYRQSMEDIKNVYFTSFSNKLKECVQNALEFEKANGECEIHSTEHLNASNKSPLESRDSGICSHFRDCENPRLCNAETNMSDFHMIHKCDHCIGHYLGNRNKSEINFIHPDTMSEIDTGSVTISDQIKRFNDRYDIVIASQNRDHQDDDILQLCNDCISLGGQSV